MVEISTVKAKARDKVVATIVSSRVVLGLLTFAGIAMLISSLPKAIAHFA